MRLHDETWKNIVTKWTSSKTFRTELYLTEKNPSPKGLVPYYYAEESNKVS